MQPKICIKYVKTRTEKINRVSKRMKSAWIAKTVKTALNAGLFVFSQGLQRNKKLLSTRAKLANLN